MSLALPNPSILQETFSAQRFVVVQDVISSSQIERWREQAVAISHLARSIVRNEHGAELVYEVITGDKIRSRWPELFAFYRSDCLQRWVAGVTGEESIFTSTHLASGVNLNVMKGRGSVYRWHFDAIPYTALLYLTDGSPAGGGALELIVSDQPHQVPVTRERETRRIWPRAGMMLLMDGTRCYHRVSTILAPTLRLSIPMVFPAKISARPTGLDDYLYDAAA